MQNNKCPGNDGLTKEFYEIFWNRLKEIFRKVLTDIIYSQQTAYIKNRHIDISKNIFACLFSIHNIISLSRHEQVCCKTERKTSDVTEIVFFSYNEQ